MTPIPYARNVALLATCQALFFSSNAMVISTTALIGLKLSPSPALSSLAFGLQYAGTMSASLPASFLMQRFGRRRGFQIGSGFGVVAGLLGAHAIANASFVEFCAAGFLYGVFWSHCQFFRFAAVDVANNAATTADEIARLRGKALGWVMTGGTVAAVVGGQLAKATQDAIPSALFAGCFVAVGIIALLICLLVSALDPLHPRVPKGAVTRSVRAIASQPIAIAAFVTSLVAYVSMNMLMTATPLAMTSCGHAFNDGATVIQWHLLGMFAPSLVTGHLIARFGAARLCVTGLLLMSGCVAVDLTGTHFAQFAVGSFLLGIGWNFMFIGATALLAGSHTEAEKAKVQGLNDFLVFLSVGISASSAGALHHYVGWQIMNIMVIPGLVVAAIFLRKVMVANGAAGNTPRSR